jgi:hypothetical protein
MPELTTSEVARLLEIKPDNLRKWKARGLLKLAPQGVPGQGRGVECLWSVDAIQEVRDLIATPMRDRYLALHKRS